MSSDREYIKELFDRDGIEAPESLSEGSMLAMLESADSAQEKPEIQEEFVKRNRSSRPSVKRIAAIAAAALVAVLGISGLYGIISAPPDTSSVDGELYTFSNEGEIKRLISDLDGSPGFSFPASGEEELVDYEGTPMADGADTGGRLVSNSVQDKAAGASHSETYLQVDNVDEADIVKTDGKYIYYVTRRSEVVILSAKDGKTEKLSVIGSEGVENYINDIYLKENRLITVGTIYKDDSDEGSAGIAVYDISDRSKPEMLYDFSQTGSILTSRMVGDYIYLVTNDYVYKGGKRIVPACGVSGSMEKLDASSICCVPEPERSSYIVLSAVDITSGSQGKSATKAIFGASEEVYCNDHNLYAVASEWDEKTGTNYTRIVRAALDGTAVKFNATAKVRGYVATQFAMDEQDGYLRIATTSERAGMDVNNLFILDSGLREAGKVTGFARNESIKAVRYIGSKAYVITYEAMDPLFIIDLSDPAEPHIEGEVMIDGFSTLLIPVSSDRLLGIGHATGDNGYGGEYDSGLKLALFDISDPSHPDVLDSMEFENMSSFAQDDHHALMVNSDEDYYAIPYEIWNYSVDDGGIIIDEDIEESASDEVYYEPDPAYETGVLAFKAGNKIGPVDKKKLDGEQICRSVYIGDWVYALDSDGNVKSFKPAF